MSKNIIIRSKSEKISIQLDNKTIIVLILLSCFSFFLFIIGLSVGSTLINPITVIKEVLGFSNGEYSFIITQLRLPRMLLALMVGASLGLSGLILQGLVRNPLASPDIIGITGGAKVAAVLFLTFLTLDDIKMLPFVAIIGAGISFVIIYTLAWKKGISPVRLVLIGIGIESLLSALVTMMIVLSPTYSTSEAYVWLTGSVYGASWNNVYAMLPWVLILMPTTLVLSRKINILELGDDLAKAVGSNVQLSRFVFIFLSVALAGSAVAFAGGIGFIGLIAPHIARKLVGRSFGSLVPITAIVGGTIVFTADVVARTVFLPLDIPAGVFVSGMGAPFFIYLLYRERNI